MTPDELRAACECAEIVDAERTAHGWQSPARRAPTCLPCHVLELSEALRGLMRPCDHWRDDEIKDSRPLTLTYSTGRPALAARAALRRLLGDPA